MATPIEELASFLQSLKLEKYRAEALEWCDEMGAVYLDEVWDYREQFADTLKLKPLERMRLTGQKAIDALQESKAKHEHNDDEDGPKYKRGKEKKEESMKIFLQKFERSDRFKEGYIFLNEFEDQSKPGSHSIQVRFDEEIAKVAQIIEEQTGTKPRELLYSKGYGSVAKTLHMTSNRKIMCLSDFDFSSGMTIFYNYSGYSVFVTALAGKKMTLLDVGPDSKIEDLKAKIQEQDSTFSDKQKYFLQFKGLQLFDCATLADSKIRNRSTLRLVLDPRPPVVFLKKPNGETLTLEYRPEETVGSCKTTLKDKDGIAESQRRWVFQGETLKDNQILADYTIFKESTLYEILHLRGD